MVSPFYLSVIHSLFSKWKLFKMSPNQQSRSKKKWQKSCQTQKALKSCHEPCIVKRTLHPVMEIKFISQTEDAVYTSIDDQRYATVCYGQELNTESDDCEILGLQRQGACNACSQSKECCTVPKSSSHVRSMRLAQWRYPMVAEGTLCVWSFQCAKLLNLGCLVPIVNATA